MILLEAVNLILPKLGEHRVTSLNIKHPTLAVILPEIDNELKQLLMKGWWFNEFDVTLYPDPEGNIAVGSDVLVFTPYIENTAVQRGLRLFNPVTLNYTFTEPVKGRVRQYVPFDELPEQAAQFVYHAGLVSAYITDIGMSTDVQSWGGKAANAWSDLLAEHLRQQKYNTRQSRKFRNYVRALRG